MEDSGWDKITTERFVLFFDILGFKDLVQRNTHEKVLEKLTKLNTNIRAIHEKLDAEQAKRYDINKAQVRSTTFSDSIIFFTKGAEHGDLLAIMLAGGEFLRRACEAGVPLKGAFSYGKITVDFKENIFFGQPIIDAYLLHEELQILWLVADHHFQFKYDQIEAETKKSFEALCSYKVPLKSKKVTHNLLVPFVKQLDTYEKNVKKMYMEVSGSPRVYIDNTLEFLEYYKNEIEKKDKAQANKLEEK